VNDPAEPCRRPLTLAGLSLSKHRHSFALPFLKKRNSHSPTSPPQFTHRFWRRPFILRSLPAFLGANLVPNRIAGVPFDTLRKALADTPCLTTPITAVSLGPRLDQCDVVVGYVQPKEAMSLLRRWHVRFGHLPVVPISSFLAICAWVIVRANKLDDVCVSLGCLDSRQFGGIGSDTLVVGMPSARARQMISR
jgi:hypothetical protein